MKLSPAIEKWLAYVALTYTMIAVMYTVGARCAGSPWADAIKTLPAETRAIRTRSIRARCQIFAVSAVVALTTVVLWKPFRRT